MILHFKPTLRSKYAQRLLQDILRIGFPPYLHENVPHKKNLTESNVQFHGNSSNPHKLDYNAEKFTRKSANKASQSKSRRIHAAVERN